MRRLVGVLVGVACAGGFLIASAQVQTPENQSATSTSTSANCDLIVHVDGLRNTHGKVGTIVFNSPSGWPEDKTKALRHGPSDIVMTPTGPTSTAEWKDLPPGDYAVAAIHDENENHKLDRNFFGFPTEGFGFANNPPVGLKAPAYQKAVVHLTCPSTETHIHIQYR